MLSVIPWGVRSCPRRSARALVDMTTTAVFEDFHYLVTKRVQLHYSRWRLLAHVAIVGKYVNDFIHEI